MEYKLELLQKRVNHLEDLILTINDKIGSVLDEFFSHRAKRAADEESLCLSALTKLKSSFDIPERRESGGFDPGTSGSRFRSSEPVSASESRRSESHQPINLNNPLFRPSARAQSTPPGQAEDIKPTTAFGHHEQTLATGKKVIEIITVEDNECGDDELGRPINDQVDTKVNVTLLRNLVHQKTSHSGVNTNRNEPAHVDKVSGNYVDHDQNSTSHENTGGHIDGDGIDDNIIDIDDSDAITIYSDSENEDGDKNAHTNDGTMSMLCEPEIYIKTENTSSNQGTNIAIPLDQFLESEPATATTVPTVGPINVNKKVNGNDNNSDQPTEPNEPEHEQPEPSPEVVEVESHNVNANSRGGSTGQNYKRVRSFHTLDEGKIYMKVNGLTCRSNRETGAGKKYHYRCKGSGCKKLMYLLENRDNGRTVLYDKHTVPHSNHPPIKISLPTQKPRTSNGGNGGGSSEPASQFKLVQTFQSRADAVALVQEQAPGAWMLNQVVECPDDIKAYYNCGLTSGRSCPVVMILRTFKENGKVDQYVWQGKHVHDPEAGAGRTLADYFTPPATVYTKKDGKAFECTHIFSTEEEAKAEVTADPNAAWEPRSCNHTLEGKKQYFFCRHRNCRKTMHLRHVVLAGKIFQYVREGEHDHSQAINPKKKRKPGSGRPRLANSASGPRRCHKPREWAKVATFSSEDGARNHVRSEMAWTMRNLLKKDGYKKINYYCKHDTKCPVRSYVRVEDGTGVATMYISSSDAHDHSQRGPPKRNRRPALPAEMKKVFDELYAQGFISGEKILQELDRRGTPMPAYHVLEYVARVRRLKYGIGRGRKPKMGIRIKKTAAGRVLSANPKNEKIRKAKAEAAAAKRGRAEKVNVNNGQSQSRAASATTTNRSSLTHSTPSTSSKATSRLGNGNASTPIQVKTERLDPNSAPGGDVKLSPFRKMFGRQACIKLKRIEVIDL